MTFNNRFIVSGKKYPGWRYAYNPCTPVNVGQNDPDADPHKLCRDVAVSFFRDLQILRTKEQYTSFFPISNFLLRLLSGIVLLVFFSFAFSFSFSCRVSASASATCFRFTPDPAPLASLNLDQS